MLRQLLRTANLRGVSALNIAPFSTKKPAKFDINADTLNPLNKRDDHPYITGGAKYMPGFSFPAPRDLSSIVKFALLERESPEEIKMIWTKFHQSRIDSVATVLDAATYKGFRERAAKCPNFVYPVRKGEGKFFTLFAQWQDRHCIFTYLDDYLKNPTYAEPYFAVTMFDDLLERKGVVLVRGDYSAHINKAEASRLLFLLERFYLKEPAMVEAFNKRPNEFDFNRLLTECP